MIGFNTTLLPSPKMRSLSALRRPHVAFELVTYVTKLDPNGDPYQCVLGHRCDFPLAKFKKFLASLPPSRVRDDLEDAFWSAGEMKRQFRDGR